MKTWSALVALYFSEHRQNTDVYITLLHKRLSSNKNLSFAAQQQHQETQPSVLCLTVLSNFLDHHLYLKWLLATIWFILILFNLMVKPRKKADHTKQIIPFYHGSWPLKQPGNKNEAKEKEIRHQSVTENTWPHTLILTTYPKAPQPMSRDRRMGWKVHAYFSLEGCFLVKEHFSKFTFTDSRLLYSSPRGCELVKSILISSAEDWRHITKINA